MHRLAGFVRVLVVSAAAAAAAAQGGLQWHPVGCAGANAPVHVLAQWDPDGAGPWPALVVAGGEFTVIGSVFANRVAAYDPAARVWSELGSGVNGPVRVALGLANGDLLIAGGFSMAGGVPANGIARWNGQTWSALGAGWGSQILALAELPNGDIVAGGSFSPTVGWPFHRLARWDGAAWSAFGTADATVRCLAMHGGQLVAGGDFTTIGGTPANRIATWNGAAWSALGSGVNGTVHALAEWNGRTFAGGAFTSAGGMMASGLASWSGGVWTPQMSPLVVPVFGFLAFHVFEALAVTSNGVVGTALVPVLGTGATTMVHSLGWGHLGDCYGGQLHDIVGLPDGSWLVAGSFTSLGKSAATRVNARYVGGFTPTDVVAPGIGAGGVVREIVADAAGVLFGGAFVGIGGTHATALARLDSEAWTPLSTRATEVDALVVRPDGVVLVAGAMPPIPGQLMGQLLIQHYVGQWIGPAWTADIVAISFPITLAPRTTAACGMPDGTALVSTEAGSLRLVPPHGVPSTQMLTWFSSNFIGTVDALALRGDQFVVGGDFVAFGGTATHIGLWNSVSWWTSIGNSDGRVRALAVSPGGDVIAGGDFSVVGGVAAARIARWNGATWSPLGSGLDGPVHALLLLPNGDVLAGGQFTLAGGVPAANLARWDGTSWSAIGAGTSGPVFALAKTPTGTIWVGGSFALAGGAPSDNFAALVPVQPASAQSLGGGCVGSAGPDELVATELPWLGATYRALATGLPDGLALSLLGRAQLSVPLPALLPVGVPGCTLRVDAIAQHLYVPSGGSLAVAYAVPDAVVLLGDVWYHQVVTGEIDAAGGLIAVTATDRLQLTIGDL